MYVRCVCGYDCSKGLGPMHMRFVSRQRVDSIPYTAQELVVSYVNVQCSVYCACAYTQGTVIFLQGASKSLPPCSWVFFFLVPKYQNIISAGSWCTQLDQSQKHGDEYFVHMTTTFQLTAMDLSMSAHTCCLQVRLLV